MSCLPAACLNAVTGLVIGYSGEGVTEGEVRVPVEGGLTAGSRWDSPTRRICQNCPCSVVVASMPWVLVSRTEPGWHDRSRSKAGSSFDPVGDRCVIVPWVNRKSTLRSPLGRGMVFEILLRRRCIKEAIR